MRLAFVGLAVSLAGGCSDHPTSLVVELDADEAIREVETHGRGTDGRAVFPPAGVSLGPGVTSGTIAILLPGDAPEKLWVTVRGFTSARDAATEETKVVDLRPAGETRVAVSLGAPAPCFDLPCPACGDGRIDVAEACDDGGRAAGDGCGPGCRIEAGWVCEGQPSRCAPVAPPSSGEDAGVDDAGASPADGGVTDAGEPPRCGDGRIDPDELCDDENTSPGDGCDPRCRVEGGFVCVGQPSRCEAISPPEPVCGDGVLESPEACDDANQAPGDGCSPSCQVEAGYRCSGAPSSCEPVEPPPVCGDGAVEAGEGCDDGGRAPGDGCGPACAVELGFECVGEPSSCSARCGDGLLRGGEGCDDGGRLAGDGCSDRCEVEPGHTCSGEPSVCSPDCSTACGYSCPASGCCTARCGRGDCDLDCPSGCRCLVDCSFSQTCEVECQPGSRCEIECDGANNCDQTECAPGAECIMRCGSANNCSFSECASGRWGRCPGGVLTCNAACP